MSAHHNDTVSKFFSKDRFLFETTHWLVVVRPKQVTLGSTILISKSECHSFGDLSDEESVDLRNAIKRLEKIYQNSFKPDKINYLALMMVDPHPHFHVLPRYASERTFNGNKVQDNAWPKPPIMSNLLNIDDSELSSICKIMKDSE